MLISFVDGFAMSGETLSAGFHHRPVPVVTKSAGSRKPTAIRQRSAIARSISGPTSVSSLAGAYAHSVRAISVDRIDPLLHRLRLHLGTFVVTLHFNDGMQGRLGSGDAPNLAMYWLGMPSWNKSLIELTKTRRGDRQ
jgi:hypothetical protein